MNRYFNPVANPVRLEANGQSLVWGDGSQWVLFAGPDIVEDRGLVLEVAQEVKRITTKLGIPWILKCSYDKANRQSLESFRGPGVENALQDLTYVKQKVGCLLLTDVHETTEAAPAAEVADVLQIPAFLSRQTNLILAAAKTGKVLHLKKGQFMAPLDVGSALKKAKSAGNDKMLFCERGTTFGYNRLINDMTGLVDMRSLGQPVIMDVTHSTQMPGAADGKSGGRREMIPALARAAMAVGVDGIFMEVHPDPDRALCDGPTSLPLNRLEEVLVSINNIWKTHFL